MKFLFSVVVSALVAVPAFAGDQPVLVKGHYPQVLHSVNDDVVYMTFESVSGDVTAVSSSVDTPSGLSSTGVTPGGRALLGQSATDVLYARVLQEAKDRGLR